MSSASIIYGKGDHTTQLDPDRRAELHGLARELAGELLAGRRIRRATEAEAPTTVYMQRVREAAKRRLRELGRRR